VKRFFNISVERANCRYEIEYRCRPVYYCSAGVLVSLCRTRVVCWRAIFKW